MSHLLNTKLVREVLKCTCQSKWQRGDHARKCGINFQSEGLNIANRVEQRIRDVIVAQLPDDPVRAKLLESL
jgi:hypothetical protein